MKSKEVILKSRVKKTSKSKSNTTTHSSNKGGNEILASVKVRHIQDKNVKHIEDTIVKHIQDTAIVNAINSHDASYW